MHAIRIAVIGASVLLLATTVHAADVDVEGTIAAFATAFNKGDIPAAKALMAPGVMIVDEDAPFVWSGPGSIDAWLGDLTKAEAAEGRTGAVVEISVPTREMIAGNHAYVIAPATYTFKQKGMMMRETAQMTFALLKGASDWKISAWTWTGPEAAPLR